MEINRSRIFLNAAVECIPQWYVGNTGHHIYKLTHGLEEIEFSSFRALTPDLNSLYVSIQSILNKDSNINTGSISATQLRLFKEEIAIKWLILQNKNIAWNQILNYIDSLRYRTYENEPIKLNLIISEAKTSKLGAKLNNPKYYKFFDPIGGSQSTYIRVNYDLSFVELDSIKTIRENKNQSYKFHPDFLDAFIYSLNLGEYVIVLTRNREIIIADKEGLLASLRGEAWYLYDTPTFKNAITTAIGNYRLGCNLFDVAFDLSFRRHGALLIYDQDNKVLEQISNDDSILGSHKTSHDLTAHDLLAESVASISLEKIDYVSRRKNILLEIASIDGAVVFNNEKITAYGAMIKAHESVGNHLGARTTAALSSLYWGGIPIKISSDGDISLFFIENLKEVKSFTFR